MNITTTERNRAIKKALSPIYGAKNISLVGGRGTAHGWIHLNVNVPTPQHEHNENRDGFIKCSVCWKLRRFEEQRIEKLAFETVKKIGSNIGTFIMDDSYNSVGQNILTQVEFI